MIRLGSIFGFIFSLALIFTFYLGAPEPFSAEAQATAVPSDGCVAEKVALDEGYGVTRTETHIVCPPTAERKDTKSKD